MPAAPKALATVAFLKARLDEGHDHLGLFEPFVVDALLHLSTQDFVAADVKLLVQQREQLVLPVKAVETLLGRCVKRNLLRRSGGRFWRTSVPIEDQAFEVGLSTIQHEQDSLGRALASYAAAQGVQFESAEVALSALAGVYWESREQGLNGLLLQRLAGVSPYYLRLGTTELVQAQGLRERLLRQGLLGEDCGNTVRSLFPLRWIEQNELLDLLQLFE